MVVLTVVVEGEMVVVLVVLAVVVVVLEVVLVVVVGGGEVVDAVGVVVTRVVGRRVDVEMGNGSGQFGAQLNDIERVFGWTRRP